MAIDKKLLENWLSVARKYSPAAVLQSSRSAAPRV